MIQQIYKSLRKTTLCAIRLTDSDDGEDDRQPNQEPKNPLVLSGVGKADEKKRDADSGEPQSDEAQRLRRKVVVQATDDDWRWYILYVPTGTVEYLGKNSPRHCYERDLECHLES